MRSWAQRERIWNIIGEMDSNSLTSKGPMSINPTGRDEEPEGADVEKPGRDTSGSEQNGGLASLARRARQKMGFRAHRTKFED